jgi:hypothetical protein
MKWLMCRDNSLRRTSISNEDTSSIAAAMSSSQARFFGFWIAHVQPRGHSKPLNMLLSHRPLSLIIMHIISVVRSPFLPLSIDYYWKQLTMLRSPNCEPGAAGAEKCYRGHTSVMRSFFWPSCSCIDIESSCQSGSARLRPGLLGGRINDQLLLEAYKVSASKKLESYRIYLFASIALTEKNSLDSPLRIRCFTNVCAQ